MELKSVFENNGKIPIRYACQGNNINPILEIMDAPDNVESFTLIILDSDIPEEVKKKMNIDVFDHWILFNIPGDKRIIDENDQSTGTAGINSVGEARYTGPCPPKEYQPSEHRYLFKVYALDIELDLEEGATREEVENAMKDHVIDTAELIGRYEKQ